MFDLIKIILFLIFPLIFIVKALGIFYAYKSMQEIKKSWSVQWSGSGIIEIDWGGKCIRGIYRLAFSEIGKTLPEELRFPLRFLLLFDLALCFYIGLFFYFML
jgi:hypothetical protein